MGPLAIGLDGALHVREERLTARADACRLMYVSDLHLRPRRSGRLCGQVVEAVRRVGVDAVLLGGDLVDGPTELAALRELVGSLCREAPVFAVGGNHDLRVGLGRVRDAVAGGGGVWIHDGTACVSRGRRGSRVIAVSGPEAAGAAGGDVRVLCAHNPRVWSAARHGGYDLVLAGHLHGCQGVAFTFRGRLYPGSLFYRYCCLNRQHGRARLVVSRGVSDLVPVRWGCPREVVLCFV